MEASITSFYCLTVLVRVGIKCTLVSVSNWTRFSRFFYFLVLKYLINELLVVAL